MKVRELIAKLSEFDPDLEVVTYDLDSGYYLLDEPELLTEGMYSGSDKKFWPLDGEKYVLI